MLLEKLEEEKEERRVEMRVVEGAGLRRKNETPNT